MPSLSKKQHNLMAMVANDPKAAKRLGISQSVGKEFIKADKGLKFGMGGEMKKVFAGKEAKAEEAKERKLAGSKAVYERAERKYEKETEMKKVKKYVGGGMTGLDQAAAMSGRTMPTLPAAAAGRVAPTMPTMPVATAGRPVGMKKGGSIDGVAQKGKTKGKIVKMAAGGLPSQAAARAGEALAARRAMPAQAKGARPFKKGGRACK